MLGPDEMAEYEEAQAASESPSSQPNFMLTWFNLWLAMIVAVSKPR